MAVQLYARTQTGQTVQLDIYDADPIKMSFAVEEVQNVQQTAGAFSRQFRLPHTYKNQQFFQGVFDVNSVTFNATQKATAWVQADGFYFASGNIRLVNIYLNGRENQVEYEVLFMGETNDFSAAVGDSFLCELDFSEYTHDQTYTNITNSWNAGTGFTGGTGLFNGDILYPLVEWGYRYDNNGVVQNSTMTHGYSKSFTQNSHPLEQSQMKPAIRIDAVWRKIFKTAGYGFTGAFFDSNRWKALYMLSENVARVEAAPDNTGNANINSDDSPVLANQYIYYNDDPTIFNDPGNNFNINNGYYLVSGTGSYTINVGLDWETITTNPLGADIRVDLINTNTGATIDFDTFSVGSGNDAGYNTIPFVNTINAGVSLGVRVQLFNVGSFSGFLDAPYIDFTVSAAPTFVNPTKVMPCNFKQMDFLKSVIDRFRLVLEPNKDGEKTFEITPWDQWVTQGDELDWSLKLDGSKDFKVSPLFLTQKRELVYNDQEDSDFSNFFFTQDNKKPYGQFKLDSGIELIKDTQEIKGIFAPTPLQSIPDPNSGSTASAQFIIPSLAKDNAPTDSLGRREPIIPKPRIVFYNGKRSAPRTWHLKNDAGSAVNQLVYPLVSSFEQFPPNPQTLDLHWQNDPYLFDTITAGITGRTSNTVWNTYWQDWYNLYYSPYGRIAEGQFFIHDDDISNLKFNDKIYAANSWWLPTKIMDYQVGGGGVTKVQLIRIGDVDVVAGATSATGTTGGTGGGTPCIGSCQQWAVCNNNNYVINYSSIDCFSNQQVLGSLPPQVCQLICSCNTPTSTFTGFEPYLQGVCPNGPTGATGGTAGCTGCFSWSVTNNSNAPRSFTYQTCFGGTVNPTVQPFTSAMPFCSCTGPTGVGTMTVTQFGNCNNNELPNDVTYMSYQTTLLNDQYEANMQLGISENGVTYEPFPDGQIFINSGVTNTIQQFTLADPNYYAQCAYTVTAYPSSGYSVFLQLYVGEELLISRDITNTPIGEPTTLETPTPINSVGYIFKILTLPSE